MNFFGKQIEQERKSAKLSVLELSQKSGLSEETLLQIEKGTLFPDVRQLMTLSQAFGKPKGYFFSKLAYRV